MFIMKRVAVMLVVCCLLMTSSLAAQAGSATGGEDVNPGDDVPFTVQERTAPSQDGQVWTLSVALNQEAVDNGTVLAITTQICTNDGVCDPPVNRDVAVSEDGSTFTTDLTPPNDHSYVNWRVKATYSDDSTENFPQGEWYKTWSTCYYNEGSYGGIHSDGNGCDVPATGEGEGLLPSAGIVAVMTAMGCAALIAATRRN